jgi:hypothetical protein
MNLRSTLALAALMFAAAVAAEPAIHTEDVDLFYKVYDAAAGRPTAAQLQRDYLDAGSEGLRTLAKLRNVTGERIAQTLEQRPEVYSKAKECLVVLPRVRERLQSAFRELGRLYPQARFPPVTIAVGRGKPVGVGSPVTGIQIGLEALCGTDWLNPNVEDRFVYTIVHEYAHVQQVTSVVDGENLTVLEGSLMEGAAEFTTELVAGRISYVHFDELVKGREKEIETAFVADQDKRDLKDWLNNSTPEKPGDLGYWVGYRIAKAYYQRASDKRAALREILEMTDPKALLARSGWHPGVALE